MRSFVRGFVRGFVNSLAGLSVSHQCSGPWLVGQARPLADSGPLLVPLVLVGHSNVLCVL